MTAPEVDIEDLVIAYLGTFDIVPAGQISGRMPDQPPLPFVLVQRVAGDDDYLVDYPIVQTDSFNVDQTSASDIARAVHHAMRQLRAKTPVTMPDNSIVTPYGPTKTDTAPFYLPWEPSGGGAVTDRYVARYAPRLRLPSIAGF